MNRSSTLASCKKFIRLLRISGFRFSGLIPIALGIALLLGVELLSAICMVPIFSSILGPGNGGKPFQLLPLEARSYFTALTEAGPESFPLLPLTLFVLFIQLWAAACSYAIGLRVVRTVSQFIHDLRLEYSRLSMQLSNSFFDTESSGHLLSSYFYSIDTVGGQIRALRPSLRAIITLPAYTAVLCYLSWTWTLSIFAAYTIFGPLHRKCLMRIRSLSQNRAIQLKRLSERIADVVDSGMLAKLHRKTQTELATFARHSGQITEDSISIIKHNSLLIVLQRCIFVAVLGFVLLYCASVPQSAERSLHITSLLFYLYFLRRFHTEITSLSAVLRRLAEAEGQIEQLISFFVKANLYKISDGAVTLQSLEKLSVEGLEFRYPDGTKALNGISFEIQRGEHVALIGSTGSGKTTIAQLILRMHDAPLHSIKINGVAVQDVRFDSLYKLVSYAGQHSHLFRISLRDNLLYGCTKGASDEELLELLSQLGLSERIASLPFGLDTIVGENGVQLSGGERQRVALARTLLSDGELLVLDEVTSHLDQYTESLVHTALLETYRQKT